VAELAFREKQIGIQYNLAKLAEVNELFEEKHIQMNFMELIKALDRIIDKLTIDIQRYKVREELFNSFKYLAYRLL
jgi:hypothetical protein